MGIGIKRGYEILPNNDVIFGMRITNNTDLVISDVQIILDYNESLFELQNDRILKLGNIPPGTALAAKFVLKPKRPIPNEKIEASIIYRDPKWEKHVVDMRPKEVHLPNIRKSTINQKDTLSTRPVIDKINNNEQDTRKEDSGTGASLQNPKEDNDVARMYDSYLKTVKSKHSKGEDEKSSVPIPYSRNPAPSDKKLKFPRCTTPSRKKEGNNKESKKSIKITPKHGLFIVFLAIVAIYLIQIPMVKESIIGIYGGSGTDAEKVEAITISFLNAVNESEYSVAFDMYQGKDFLVPASVELLFNNGGIEPDSIRQINIAANDVEGDTAVLSVNCTVASFDIFGKETDVSVIPVYFQLNNIELGWTVTSVSFVQPFEIKPGEEAEKLQQ